MNSTSQTILWSLLGWAEGFAAPLVAICISAVYFFTAPRGDVLPRRLAASAHGLAIAILYFVAMAVFWSHKPNPSYGTPFSLLLLVPLALIATSFFLYRGPKAIHTLHLLNLVCLAWTFFVGSMAVTGNWL